MLMTPFNSNSGLSKKRKKPEHDDIDEMLGEDNSDDDHKGRRYKDKESDNTPISLHKSSSKNSDRSSKKNRKDKWESEAYKKSGNLVVKIHEIIDKPSFDIFRKVMKKVTKKVYNHPDSIINDILIAFFNSSIGVADLKSEVVPNEVPLYFDKKKLSTELVKYMPRDIRKRYKEVLSSFYTKYELNYGQLKTEPSSQKLKKVELKPKDIKKRMDEIAQRRSELKKLAKKEEIDKKIRKVKEEIKDPEEDKEDDQGDDTDKTCIIWYSVQDLYVAKCGHYACKGCWDKWLKRYLECPKWRNRTRMNQIVPLSQETVFNKA